MPRLYCSTVQFEELGSMQGEKKKKNLYHFHKILNFKFHFCLHLIFLAKFVNANKMFIFVNSLVDDHFKQ
jgi:hypothetical protein